MNLKDKAKQLPSSPGVYLMKDSLEGIIYVGKSKNLKNRVSSYFTKSKAHSPKVIKLVQNLKDFDYILTDTEFEAFMLECQLIKELKPRYNRLMKNPEGYTYIKISVNDDFPSIEATNEANKNDKNLYFGPYTSKGTVEKAIEAIKVSCKILCSNNFKNSSACLNYSLGLCMGLCLKDFPREKYINIIDNIINLLKGNDKSIIEIMENTMNDAAFNLDFEKAAKYRDYISAVNSLIYKSKVVKHTKQNRNIVLLEYLSDSIIKCFLIKRNKVLFSETYLLKDISTKEIKVLLKSRILFYFNTKELKNSSFLAKEELDESEIIYHYIKSKANNCIHVIIAEKWLHCENGILLDNAINKLFYIK
ncbi:GIY-YIG nuclease family protein [Clostridium grantii]|uniref:Excinuclease ABC subunit C n=1 Tax=Clostridium grantii DSM 8605 TaxID=1121316 RepID=A0A1M5T5R8_9CLOT|nr:GIY-YIG nuclease family protein [Clostridium grantii]SHH45703.1 excinuclease ABC subunit C [Clostridium grantii DSM 8605]